MSDEQFQPKTMTVQEFHEKGFLQEINRRFLHPAGMALTVTVDGETGKATGFGPIWDYRDEPAGLKCNNFSKQKTVHFNQLIAQKRVERMKELGYIIQPCGQP